MESWQIYKAIFVQILRLQVRDNQLWIVLERCHEFTESLTIFGCFSFGALEQISELIHGDKIFYRQVLTDPYCLTRVKALICEYFGKHGYANSISRRSQVGWLEHFTHQTLLHHISEKLQNFAILQSHRNWLLTSSRMWNIQKWLVKRTLIRGSCPQERLLIISRQACVKCNLVGSLVACLDDRSMEHLHKVVFLDDLGAERVLIAIQQQVQLTLS